MTVSTWSRWWILGSKEPFPPKLSPNLLISSPCAFWYWLITFFTLIYHVFHFFKLTKRHCFDAKLEQPEKEFRPPISEIVESLTRLCQRFSLYKSNSVVDGIEVDPFERSFMSTHTRFISSPTVSYLSVWCCSWSIHRYNKHPINFTKFCKLVIT